MAASTTISNYLREALAKKLVDLSVDTVKLTLHSGTDPLASNWNGTTGNRYYTNITSSELATAGGYTAGGTTLTSGAVAYTGSAGGGYKYSSSAFVLTASAGLVATHAVLRDTTVVNEPILCSINLDGSGSVSASGTLTITPDSVNGWFKLA